MFEPFYYHKRYVVDILFPIDTRNTRENRPPHAKIAHTFFLRKNEGGPFSRAGSIFAGYN